MTTEMRDRLQSFDWSRTELGPLATWPQSLRIAVSICMDSRFPMFVWWGPNRINIYNDAYVPILGAKHPAAFGQPAQPTWREIWDVVGPQADAVMQRGEATWNERVLLVMQRKGYAEDTWFTWSYSPIRDERDRIVGMFCACVEDTPRVELEKQRDRLLEQVQSERARLAAAFAQSPAFLAIMRGPRHIFESVNERYIELIGMRNPIGRPVREVVPEVEGQGFFEIMDRVYSTGEPYVGEGARMMLRSKQGPGLEPRYLDFVYQPLRGSDGTVTGILAHGNDVTHRHEIERALRASEERFRQLADAMPQIVFAADPDGRVDYFNRQWYEYTGLPANDTSEESWTKAHTPEGLQRVAEAWPEALRTGQPYEIEYPLRRHDGQYRWHLGRALPVRDERGRIVRWFGTNTDIHDRKQIEDALGHALENEQRARGEAELASRMKDEFLATLSHELRTPLNAIIGWAHMMRREGATPKDLLRGAEVIERNARSQSAIIEDLLDMSAIISGKARLNVERVDVGAMLRAAIDTARPSADAKHIRIVTRLEGADGLVLHGDPNRLQQVMWNLLSNAFKFTPREGEVRVEARRAEDSLELSVSDTGQGIPPEFLPFVFDRFRQGDSSTTRKAGGLGLGLSIVKQLVELHGGAVSVASAGEGKGATFKVSLPLAGLESPAGARRADGSRAPRAPLTLPETECENLAGKRVLVVDDEPDARELLRELLENCRAHVTVAASSDEALDYVRRERFDVLVSDIAMPDKDGHDLIRAVRGMAKEHNGEIPAMALTAYARPEDRLKALRAGFQMHTAKPVDPAELIAIVASLARR
jgi:PAS domain S-box-containing protein